MDIAQQFCLRWNNYQSTLHHIFHRLWSNGTFVDVSLVVEGRRIDCHKVMLSACSTYFEQLLSEHSSHPHPLVLLHDIPFSAVESLVLFMYTGEINVSQDQLASLLRVAESLKIKGLADSAAIANFTKYRLMSPEITKVTTSQYSYPAPAPSLPTSYSLPTPYSGVTEHTNNKCYSLPVSKGLPTTPYMNGTTNKRLEPCSKSPKPLKKRPRQDTESTSLPPSPPISLGELQNGEQIRASPPEAINETNHMSPEIKVEPEDETDTELQIDETIGQSSEEATESDTLSNRDTPVPDFDAQEYNERQETAQSLAALASQATINAPPLQTTQNHQSIFTPKLTPRPIKEEKNSGNGTGKNGERSYTLQDLEDGIESVLMGHLTPAKAIAKYKVPRRTFFRRLSAVRKSRGIPSSKENASEHFLNSGSARSTATQPDGKQLPLVIPGIVSNDSTYMQNISKVPKTEEPTKKDKKLQELNLTSGSVFSLLNVAANPSYEYYLKYLKLQAQGKDILFIQDDKKEGAFDGNRNLSSEVSEHALALVAQNGSLK